MKLAFLFSILSLTASLVSARSFDDDFAADLEVRSLSWCAGNKVMAEKSNGVRLIEDCSLSRTHGRCVEHSARKGRSVLVSASCKPWNHQLQTRKSCEPWLSDSQPDKE